MTDISVDNIGSCTHDCGFTMKYDAKILPIKVEPNKTVNLLKKVREIYDMPKVPIGKEGCKDCEKLEALSNLIK